MHPREAILTDRTGVAIFDIRSHSSTQHSDLFKLSHPSLQVRERVYIHKQHEKSPYHHFVATSNNIFLLDQRFPSHPVLKWTHLLISPPVYMDIIYNITARDGCSDDVVLLGCQDYPECHAFQLSLGLGSLHPYWNGLPWRISKPR